MSQQPAKVNVKVKLFAGVKQFAGRDEIELAIPPQATIADLRAALAEQLPAAADLIRRVMFSINLEFASDRQPIPPHAELACIPPVSGG